MKTQGSSTASTLFQGHPGHLTAEQETALNEFKIKLQNASLYTPEQGGVAPSHDDATLLRFLRARKYNTAQAEQLFAASEAWRAKMGIDKLYSNFEVEEFEKGRKYYPRWTGRRDRHGIPVYVYRLASLNSQAQKELSAVSEERRYERLVALYETMLRVVCPLVSATPSPIYPMPISSTFTIIDLEDVSLRTMWNLRGHLQQASTLANANYPETLHRIYVVNAPSFFPTVWGWIKSWFDPYTRSKISILGKVSSSETREALLSEITPENLPKVYGGEFEWVFEDEPKLEEAIKQTLEEAGEEGEMPKGPVRFVVVNGKPRVVRKEGSNFETLIEEEQTTGVSRKVVDEQRDDPAPRAALA